MVVERGVASEEPSRGAREHGKTARGTAGLDSTFEVENFKGELSTSNSQHPTFNVGSLNVGPFNVERRTG
jgi:hypothetical protein